MPTGPPAPAAWKTALATASGNLYLVLGTFVMASAAVALGLLPPRGRRVFGVARLWSRGLLAASGVRVRSTFERRLDPRRSYVFMANHLSHFDIPALIHTLPGQTRFMAKRSLFRIPVFGWAIRVGGFITIDREDLSRVRDSFAVAVERLREGASVLVFPEGTRSAGGGLLPFKRGGFLLALKSGLPIVPVGIAGSRAVRPKGGVAIRPGRIDVRYGAPIEVGGFGLRGKRDLADAVRERIAELAGAAAAADSRYDPGLRG